MELGRIVAGPIRQDTVTILEQDGWKVWTSKIVQNPGHRYPAKFSGVYTKLKIFGRDMGYDRIVGSLALEGISVFLYLHLVLPMIFRILC